MMGLTSDEITAMRTAAGLALHESGTIYRPSRVTDGEGGFTTTYNTVASCQALVDPTGKAAEILQPYAERIGERQATTINFLAGQDVVEGDRVVVGGVTWEMLGILSGSMELVRVMAAVRHG